MELIIFLLAFIICILGIALISAGNTWAYRAPGTILFLSGLVAMFIVAWG